ncbi:carboxy terminal-processing peptidase [Desulfotalea psychrophila]|uniref:Probable periplasmic tail-specific proteinase n=1 Tax=Desulfotalea psychrophila (strain LSv54 / DSM 12343) TaxID=177439 RepID=Q6AIM4_DESPS|nr:carboxy terminal-processing peptidase [Desulfotalea psychrophila]CAG37806.1 probable periplasmic tail-specific proteinase [Desulfotalea psychrophila LSv54]
MKLMKSFFFSVLVLLFLSPVLHADSLTAEEQERDSLIGHMLSKQLPTLHYSDKELNDSLGEAAFSLYLKQLDYQKRFLLQEDVDVLHSHADSIDDNMRSGQVVLPSLGSEILLKRVAQVQQMVTKMVAAEIGHTPGEVYQSDPKKLSYAKSLAELEDRWRKILKAQVMSRYLDLEEEAQAAKGADLAGKKSGEGTRKSVSSNFKKMWAEATEKVAKQNKTFLHRLTQETLQDHTDRFFNSVARAFGPHTNYIPPASKEQFDINMRGSLEGIGALLKEEDGMIKVVRVIPGSASARQGGLEIEDAILSVGQGDEEPVDVSDMRLRDAVRLIRGAKGTEVRLTVRKNGGLKSVVPIIRDVVQMEDTFVKSLVVKGDDGARIGYINIPSFYRDFEKSKKGEKGRNSTDDTRVEVLKLKALGVDGIVLDLRNNGGGALVDAIDIAGLFVKEGPMVQVRTSMGDKRILFDQDEGIVYAGPLVILVNKFSASASEIVAAALQDYHRAVIMGGAHTHGKGSVQTVLDLNEYVPWLSMANYEDLGALKIMIQKFYRVNGGSTQYKGVEPDIVLPSIYEHLKSGERYLDYSLPWDSIEAIDYTTFSLSPDIEKIRKNSLVRVKKNKEFDIIRDEVAKAEERSLDTYIYLDIERMRGDRRMAKAARKRLGAEVGLLEEEPKSTISETEAEKESHWRQGVSRDPWVQEAGRVIADIGRQVS